jgi:asparagine synthase (glutamine-hydrolysing)
MSPSYLLVAGGDRQGRSALVQRIAERSGLALAFTNRWVAALVGPSCPCLAVNGAGCILGRIFERSGPPTAVQSVGDDEAAVIAATEGRSLLASHWGGYVAAIRGEGSVTILRDPSADFPCYFVSTGQVTVFASDAELLVRTGLVDIAVDYDEIGRQLFRAFVPVPATALHGVHELLAGFAIHISDRVSPQEQCWNPWDHVDRSDQDPIEESRALARTIQHAIQATASPYGRLLVSVSGGLDSSIVALCLARARADIICLTMFTDDPAGDERLFARVLCDGLGLKLIERQYRFEDIDLDQAIAANFPRPRDRLQALAFERVHYAVAAELGADAFVTGNGGDHVFGYSQSAAPVADRYLTEGLSRGTLASLIDVCRQTGCGMADALRQAWTLVHSDHRYVVRPNRLLLSPGFAASLGPGDWHHPWLDAPGAALPGKAAHVATILRVQPNLEPSLGTAYPVLNPLVSQPVVEHCLKIPSWSWREGGRDRALVRRAFADALPPAVRDRRVKGTPGRFAARLLDHFRPALRERLLSGRLAAAGIIDAVEIDRILTGERPVGDLERVRILELINAETWIAHWQSRPRILKPVEPVQIA